VKEDTERIERLIAAMTLDEKAAMTAGSDLWHGTGVPRLGIPALKVTDGPIGARGDGVSGASAACFPAASALASTWNLALAEQVGAALGDEARSKGAQILLGPTINLQRTPLGGRNFECYSEDPWLTARLATAFVRGVQSRGVGACLKHFVCNDQERERHTLDVVADDRTLREVYLLPFELAIRDAEPWSAMAAYNRINGIHACAHRELLQRVLKEEWGFQGFVVSDWGASRSTVDDANAGLDLEMPAPSRTLGARLAEAVRAGRVSERTLDDKVRRLLRVTLWTGRLDAAAEQPERTEDRPEHRALARRVAAEGMVLLANRGLLPLDPARVRRLAVIGPNSEPGQIQGGGSAAVRPHYSMAPLAGIRRRAGSALSVEHELGCRTPKYAPELPRERLTPSKGDGNGLLYEVFRDPELRGEPIETRVVRHTRAVWFGRVTADLDTRRFGVRYSGTYVPQVSGDHLFGLLATAHARVRADGRELLAVDPSSPRGDAFFGLASAEARAELRLEAGTPVSLDVEFAREGEPGLSGLQFGVLEPEPYDRLARAEALARDADAVVLVVGTNDDWETEGNDRETLELPPPQDELCARVLAANPNTVIVLNTGAPVAMPWLSKAGAVLQAWFPGQEFGSALADLLFGDLAPSGKLPSTFPHRLSDVPAQSTPSEPGRLRYREGLRVGYRGYQVEGIEPLFPFGHGLSYTSFAYGALDAPRELRAGEELVARVPVTNTGARAGAEVVQLYVRALASRPPRPAAAELRAFAKLELAPGETRNAELVLEPRALASWDAEASRWSIEPGEYELLAGASSADIRTRARITVRSK
jgi:beta-glucosidase